MNGKTWVYMLFLGLLLTPVLFCESLKIRVTDYPPQYSKSATGQWTGLDVEITEAILKDAGITPEFVELPWSRALAMLKTGEVEIMCNLSKTAERSEFVNWVGPERFSQMALIVLKKDVNMNIRTLDELIKKSDEMNKRIAVQQNAFYGQIFKDRLAKDTAFADHFVVVPEAQQFAPMLQKGRILGFFEETTNIKYKIKKDPVFAAFAINSFVIYKEPVYLGISKKVPDAVLKRLQQSYMKLENNGGLDKIRNKYY